MVRGSSSSTQPMLQPDFISSPDVIKCVPHCRITPSTLAGLKPLLVLLPRRLRTRVCAADVVSKQTHPRITGPTMQCLDAPKSLVPMARIRMQCWGRILCCCRRGSCRKQQPCGALPPSSPAPSARMPRMHEVGNVPGPHSAAVEGACTGASISHSSSSRSRAPIHGHATWPPSPSTSAEQPLPPLPGPRQRWRRACSCQRPRRQGSAVQWRPCCSSCPAGINCGRRRCRWAAGTESTRIGGREKDERWENCRRHGPNGPVLFSAGDVALLSITAVDLGVAVLQVAVCETLGREQRHLHARFNAGNLRPL
jgi:hypothetical protein